MCLLCEELPNILIRPKCCLDFNEYDANDSAKMWIQLLERDLTINEVELIEQRAVAVSYSTPVYEIAPIESTYLYYCIVSHRPIPPINFSLDFLNRRSSFCGGTFLSYAIRHFASDFAIFLIDFGVDIHNAIDECLCARNVCVLKHLLAKGYRPTNISWFNRFAEQPGYDEILKCL